MFFLWAIASILHVSLACAAHHKHRHRALAQPSTATETRGVAVAIPTNPGSSVPIDIGIDGYATSKT
jgi:hypothetical protein